MNNKKKVIIAGSMGLVLILVLGITYAWLIQVITTTKVNKITVGGLSLVLDDNASNGINLINELPQTDSQGLETEAYTFTLKNNGASNAEYRLILEDEDVEGDRIADSNIKYSLVKNDEAPVTGLLTSTHKTVDDVTVRELDNDILDSRATNTYSLRLWIDQESSQSEVGGKEFKSKIKLEAVQTENSYEDKYKIEGYLYNDNNELVTNGVIVAYSEPRYSTIDSEGHFSINGIKYGNHTLYYVAGKTESELRNMNENQIKNLNGIGKVRINTSSSVFPIVLNNGYSVKNGSITKTIQEIGPTIVEGSAEDVNKNATRYYGQIVSNYSSPTMPNMIWRVFHSDGENIYLISEERIPYDNLPTKGGYAFKQGYGTSDGVLTAGMPTSDILNMYPGNSTGEKFVALLLDHDLWSGFRNSAYADYAVGGPTIQQYIDSYNNVHPDRQIEYTENEKKYLTGIRWQGNEGYEDTLKYLDIASYNGIYGSNQVCSASQRYYTATVLGSNPEYTYYLHDVTKNNEGGFINAAWINYYTGYRIVVRINKDYLLKSNNTGGYNLQK